MYTQKMEKLHVPQPHWWDWPAVGLLFVLLQTVASRLVVTTWIPFLHLIQNYDSHIPGRLWFLAFFAFIALLLLGRLQHLQNKSSWRARHVFLSPDNSIDLTSSMAIAAGLIIVVAWTAPASLASMKSAVKVWDRISHPWRQFTDRMENAVSALQSPSGGRPGEFFGSELT